MQQLTNVPIDIRIEEWIQREFAALREVQAASLRQDVKDRYASLHPLIKKMNPRRVYRANQVLNAAWAEFVGKLLEERELSRPYRGTRFRTIGKRLLRHLEEGQDAGAPGDRREVDHWAWELATEGWYEWTTLSKQDASQEIATEQP